MLFKVSHGKYGFQLHVEGFKCNLVLRLFKTFDVEHTIGIRNNTEDGKRLLFLDYENILFSEHLLPELLWLQLTYKLSNFYVFESSQKFGNYHVICLDKLKAREWMEIIEQTNCDSNYKRVPVFIDNKAWVLRFVPKRKSKMPKHILTLKSKYQKREKSNAHALFLSKWYDIDLQNIKNLDAYTNITITEYSTLNYIK